MSHAIVMVALSPEDLEAAGGKIEDAVLHQMEPFSEDERGGWFAEGSRWDWWVVGGRFTGRLLGKDIAKRSELDEAQLREFNIARRRKLWAEYQAETSSGRDYIYGVKEGDTEETYVNRRAHFSAPAFLKDRRWCESKRMGWFGGTAATECEIEAAERGAEYEGRCLHTCEKTGAKIVTWGEDDDRWAELFWARFIRRLPPETTLVAVDYHV